MAEETLTPDNAKPARKPRAPKVAGSGESVNAMGDSAGAGTKQAKAKFAAAIDELLLKSEATIPNHLRRTPIRVRRRSGCSIRCMSAPPGRSNGGQ